MKIAIFGASGFLGTKLKKVFLKKGYIVFGIDSKGKSGFKVDATKKRQVASFLKKYKPEVVVDLIALTSSVDCEKNPKKAKLLNYKTAKIISKITKKMGSKLFFISSSYLFNGEKGNYSEKNKLSPLGVYDREKILAEKELLKNKDNVILRVDLLYGYNGKLGPNSIFGNVLLNKEILLGNFNQIRSPLFIGDVPEIIEKICLLRKGGIFHAAGSEKIKMNLFVRRLENLVRKNSKIKELKSTKLLVPPRKDSSLDNSKLKNLGIKFTPIKKALKIIKKELKE